MSARSLAGPGPRLVWRAVFVLALVAVAVAALAPSLPMAPPIPHFDKVEHAAGFLVLTLLGRAAGLGLRPLAVGLLAYGVGIELAQGAFTATREPSVLDALADAAGIGLGLLLIRRRRRG